MAGGSFFKIQRLCQGHSNPCGDEMRGQPCWLLLALPGCQNCPRIYEDISSFQPLHTLVWGDEGCLPRESHLSSVLCPPAAVLSSVTCGGCVARSDSYVQLRLGLFPTLTAKNLHFAAAIRRAGGKDILSATRLRSFQATKPFYRLAQPGCPP